jgi:coronin-1B/1C/6
MSGSTFKNALGEDQKEVFTKCDVTTVSTEGRLLAVNGNFLAMAWNNRGEIVVVDSSKPFGIKPDQPRIKGHHSNVLDLEFSPFSSDLLATSFDDYAVLLYKIPEGGLKEHMKQEVQIYQKHTRKVPHVTFNPVASDVICSGAFQGEIHVWNVLKGETYVELKADDTPTMVQWNPNGTLVGATTKNKFMNVFDPRANKMIFKHQINEKIQSAKFAWIDNDSFVTTSWNQSGAKFLKLWDVRKVKGDLSSEGAVTEVKIDSSTTVTTPFVDRESKLIYTIGKGEAGIHTYDYSEGKFKKGIDFSSKEPSISSVMFDRKALDYNTLEIDRFARYVNSKKVYYVTYRIARRNPGYNPALYPPVECGEPALTYDQWVGGQTAEPIKKEINTIDNKFVSQVETFIKQEAKVEKKTPEGKIKELEGKIAEISVKINQITEENIKLKKQIDELKAKKQENSNQQVIEQAPSQETDNQNQQAQSEEEAKPEEQAQPQEEAKPEEQGNLQLEVRVEEEQVKQEEPQPDQEPKPEEEAKPEEQAQPQEEAQPEEEENPQLQIRLENNEEES